MRLPRARFTVRRLMAGVAIVALGFGLESWIRRYPYCRSNAARSASAERGHLRLAESHEKVSALYRRRAADGRGSFRFNDEQAAFFGRAARVEHMEATRAAERGVAFLRAARYPWLSTPPREVDPLASDDGIRPVVYVLDESRGMGRGPKGPGH